MLANVPKAKTKWMKMKRGNVTKKGDNDTNIKKTSIEMIKEPPGTSSFGPNTSSAEETSEIPTTGEELLKWARARTSIISGASTSEESVMAFENEVELPLPSTRKKSKSDKSEKIQKEKKTQKTKKTRKKSRLSSSERLTDEDLVDPTVKGPLEDEVMFQWRLKKEEERRLSKKKNKSEVTFLEPTVNVERRSSSLQDLKKGRRKTRRSFLAAKKEAQRLLEKELEEQRRRDELFQKALLKQQQEEDEELLREQRNQVTLRRIKHFEKERLENIWALFRLSEAEHYRTCEKIPLVTRQDQLTSFVKKWEEEIDDMSIEDLGKICSVNLELLRQLRELIFYTSPENSEKMNQWTWASGLLREIQEEMLERAMYNILSDVYKNLTIDNMDYGEYHYKNSSFTLSIWLKLDWPVSLPNPRKPAEPNTEIHLNVVDITCIIPQSIQCDQKALTCLYVPYDHVSDTCKTFYPPPKPEYLTKDLSETNYEDKLLRQKYAYESLLRSEYKEKVEKFKEKHPDEKYPTPFLLPEVPLDENIPKTPVQNLDPTPNEYVDLADDIFYATCMNSLFKETIPDVVNLREYQIIGGLYRIQLIYHPPQPQPLVKFHMTVRTVKQPKRLQNVPFYQEFRPPPLPWLEDETSRSLTSTTKSLRSVRSKRLTARYASKTDTVKGGGFDPEEVQKYKEAQEEWERKVQLEKEKILAISMSLPENVIFLEKPNICLWDEKSKVWSASDIYEVDYEYADRRVTFRSSRFGLFGLSVKRYLNYPYKSWDLRPNADDSISMVLEGSKVTIQLIFQESNIRIVDFEYRLSEYLVGKKGLNCLKSKNMSLARFIEMVQSSGLDMFPDFDANCYYTATTEKHWATAFVTYYAMAQSIIRYNFASSKWNLETGRRSIVMRLREFDPSDEISLLRSFDLVQVTPLRCQVLTCTEDDENFSDEASFLHKFQPNLQYLLKSMSNVTNRAKIKEFSPATVYTLAEFLTRTRIFSFS